MPGGSAAVAGEPPLGLARRPLQRLGVPLVRGDARGDHLVEHRLRGRMLTALGVCPHQLAVRGLVDRDLRGLQPRDQGAGDVEPAGPDQPPDQLGRVRARRGDAVLQHLVEQFDRVIGPLRGDEGVEQGAVVTPVGEGAAGPQFVEQSASLVEPLGPDQLLHDVPCRAPVDRDPRSRHQPQQAERHVELTGLEVPGQDVGRLLGRDRHTEDQHPVQHAAGRGEPPGSEAQLDEPIEVLPGGDPTSGSELQRARPRPIHVLPGDPRLEHRVVVEARRVCARLLHRGQRGLRRRRIPRLGVREQELGVDVAG